MTKVITNRQQSGSALTYRYFLSRVHLLAVLAIPTISTAAVEVEASAKAQYEVNSNVFDNQGAAPPPGTDISGRSDRFLAEGADLRIHDYIGRQDLYLGASGTQYHYDRFSELDHSDYKFNGGMKWKLASILNGYVEVARTRAMTSFLDTTNSALSLQTEQRESAEVNFRIAPDWRLTGSGLTRDTDQTQLNGPNLRLSEQSGTIALSYLGLGDFTSGVDGSYVTGSYSGDPLNLQPSYHQIAFDLLGTYKGGGRSTFNGSLGYSDRTSANGLNNTSGVTGDFNFQDQLTPKTSVSIDFRRSINAYIAQTGSEIDTSAQVGVAWRATFKFDVTLAYNFMYRDFPGQHTHLDGTPIGAQRVDIQQTASIGLNYHPARWLDLLAYANVLTRRSDARENNFDATVYGINFVVKKPKRDGRP